MDLDKSEISFSHNLGEDVRESVPSIMGVKPVVSHAKYLGLPFVLGR